MNKFQRENRYLVFKIKDIEAADSKMPIKEILTSISLELPDRQYVVVESDWPEYEQVWNMLEARMTGRSTELEKLKSEVSHLDNIISGLLSALYELTTIVKIHSETTGNNFAWAEVSEAEALLNELRN